MSLVAEIEEELAAMRLDALLRRGEIVDLKAEMVRADETVAFRQIRRLATLVALEVEQGEIDDAVAHIYSGADLQILATDTLELEHVLIERCGLVEILHDDGKVAETSHAILPTRGARAVRHGRGPVRHHRRTAARRHPVAYGLHCRHGCKRPAG